MKELTTRQLFEQIIKRLEEREIFLKIYGDEIYLVQNETGQMHKIKIGEFKHLEAKKYNESCDLDWNQEFKDYWKDKK